MTDRIRNVRIIDRDRDAAKDKDVHLRGALAATDHITLCGWSWVEHEATDERVTCENCIAALDHARALARSARRLLPKPPPPRRYSAEDDDDT